MLDSRSVSVRSRGASAWPLLLIILALAVLAGLYFGGVFDGGQATDDVDVSQGDTDNDTIQGDTTNETLTSDGGTRSTTLAGLYGEGDEGAIRLRLIQAGSKSPVEGQMVKVITRLNEELASLTSGEGGVTLFKSVRPGSMYRLQIAPGDGPVLTLTDIRVRARQTTDLGDVPIGQAIVLRGRVLDERGRPVPDAAVQAFPPTRTTGRDGILFERARQSSATLAALDATQTDEQGYFALTRLEDGSYTVVGRKRGLASDHENDIVIERERGTGSLTLVLGTAGTVFGRVTDHDNKPLAGAEVVATYDRGWRNMMSGNLEFEVARTDSNGEYSLETLALGAKYTFGIRAEGYAPIFSAESMPIERKKRRDFQLQLGGSIKGVVTDEATSEPIEGAEVAVFVGRMRRGTNSSAIGRTNAKGEYELSNLPAGPVLSAGFKAQGYITDSRSQWAGNQFPAIEAGKVNEVDAALKKGGSIRGRITNAKGGAPMQGVDVSAVTGISMFVGGASTVSDANGDYVLEGVANGDVQVVALFPGFAQVEGTAAVKVEGGEVSHDVTMTEAGSVSGVVADVEGTPIEGLRVRLREKREGRGGWSGGARRSRSVRMIQGATRGATITDTKGRFTLRGVGPGAKWIAVATGDEYVESESKPFEVEAGAVESVRIEMLKGGSLKGRVLDEDNRWLPGARVRVATLSEELAKKPKLNAWELRGVFRGEPYVADEQGRFEFTGLKPGRLIVEATKEDYVTWYKRDVRMQNDQHVDNYMISMKRGSIIKGRVLDLDDKPIENVWVGISTSADPGRENEQENANQEDEDTVTPTNFAQTEKDGSFKIENIPAGTYSVVVWWARGYKNFRASAAESAIKRDVVPPNDTPIVFKLEPEEAGERPGR